MPLHCSQVARLGAGDAGPCPFDEEFLVITAYRWGRLCLKLFFLHRFLLGVI